MKSYFLITTQCLENYGAHCDSGKFSDGKAYWKLKGGERYLVSYEVKLGTVGREANAVAFMTAYLQKRNDSIHFKEITRNCEQIHQGETPPHVDLDGELLEDYTEIDIDEYFRSANSNNPHLEHRKEVVA